MEDFTEQLMVASQAAEQLVAAFEDSQVVSGDLGTSLLKVGLNPRPHRPTPSILEVRSKIFKVEKLAARCLEVSPNPNSTDAQVANQKLSRFETGTLEAQLLEVCQRLSALG